LARRVHDLLGIDEGCAVDVGQDRQQAARGLLQPDLDAERPLRLDGLDILEDGLAGAGRRAPALERGDDVRRAQRLAVVELDAVAQVDDVAPAAVEGFRALGEERHGLVLRVEREQPLVDVDDDLAGDHRRRRVRVERRRLADQRDAQDAACFGRGRRLGRGRWLRRRRLRLAGRGGQPRRDGQQCRDSESPGDTVHGRPPVGFVRYRGPPPAESARVSPMSGPLVIHGATIVTADDAGTLHPDGALAVEHGRIVALGPAADVLGHYASAERIDARGRVILPGFANTHTHLARVLARGIYEDLSPPHTPPFTGGLAPLPLPSLSADEERLMAVLGALADTGLRLVLCERAWDRGRASIGQPGPFERDAALAEAGLARIREFHARWHGRGDGRVSAGVAAWAPDLCSPELLGRVRKLQD